MIAVWMGLVACARHEVPHAAPDMAPDAPEEAAPTRPPPPAASWRSGVLPGPAVLGPPMELWSQMLSGPVTEPLATDGARVYAVAEGRVSCFGLDGVACWSARSLATGPVASSSEGPVVGTATGALLLDRNTGSTVSTWPSEPVRGAALQLPSSVVWATTHGVAGSGGAWWADPASTLAGGAAGDLGTIYVATLEGQLLALDRSGVQWARPLPAPAVEGPALDANAVYVAVASTPGHPGGVIAYGRDGIERWRYQTEFQPAAPLAVGEHVYIADKDGHVYALARDTGAVVWSVEGFGEFGAQPLVLDGQLYAGNADGNLYRIDTADGGVVWRIQLGAAVTGDPVAVGGTIVVGLANGRIVAVAGRE